MPLLERRQECSLYFRPSKRTTNLLYFPIPVPSTMVKEMKSCQHLVTCFRLNATHGTPRRCFCTVLFTPPASMGLRLRMRKFKWLEWQQRSMMVLLRLPARPCRWQNLMSSNIATWICSSESIKKTTRRFRCAVDQMPSIILSHNLSVRMGSTIRE